MAWKIYFSHLKVDKMLSQNITKKLCVCFKGSSHYIVSICNACNKLLSTQC